VFIKLSFILIFTVKMPHHDKEFEDELLSSAVDDKDFVKYVDWDGNIAYSLPKSYDTLFKLEHFANNPDYPLMDKVKKRFRINDLVDVYKHVRHGLFANDLPLDQQSDQDLSNIYNRILNDVGLTGDRNKMLTTIEDYIVGLTLLVVLDNDNKKLIDRLEDFDLDLVATLKLPESSELGRFGKIHKKFKNILDRRYQKVYKKQIKDVDDYIKKYGMLNDKEDLESPISARSNFKRFRYESIIYIKHIIDPFTGDRYISFYIDNGNFRTHDLIPYKEGLNFDNIVNSNLLDITRAMDSRFLKFKDIPDNVNAKEYRIFVHKNNMRRMEKIKDMLDMEDQEVINNYPFNDMSKFPSYYSRSYHFNYKPLVFLALKYEPNFLRYHHENVETDAVSVLEVIVRKYYGSN